MADPVGVHVIADLHGCPFDLINDSAYVEKVMTEAASVSDVTILDAHFREFTPQGVTGVLLLSESHMSFHSWPELNLATVDFFTCGRVDPAVAIDHLKKNFQSRVVKINRLLRGT